MEYPMKFNPDREVCQVRGEDGVADLVCWTPAGWLLGDGRIVPPSQVLQVRAKGVFTLRERWSASTFPGESFRPVRVRGHQGGKWVTDRGNYEVIHQPTPELERDGDLRRAGRKPLKFHAYDLYTESFFPHWDLNNPASPPFYCEIVGHLEGCWRSSDGQLLLPQDLALTGPTNLGETQFRAPIRCLDGTVATGHDGTQFVTQSGPKPALIGPIPPRAAVSEARIADMLRHVPAELLIHAHRESVSRDMGLTASQAAKQFNVTLPSELLFPRPHGPLCPVGAFLRWYVGFSASDVAVIHPPEFVDYRRRIDSLVARLDAKTRALWNATQAGDAVARRKLADRVEGQGDRGRAALLRRGEPRPPYRNLDDEWYDHE